MRRAFTLMELLVVMGLMGLLAVISIGSYNAFSRGMEERGVMENVNTFIRAAYQRAQIDREPVAVVFWNECVKTDTADDYAQVVGHAVAIRRHGRFSWVQGSTLADEFADLNATYPTIDQTSGSQAQMGIYIYPMDKLSSLATSTTLKRSLVHFTVKEIDIPEVFLSGKKSETYADSPTSDSGADYNKIVSYAFTVSNAGGVQWKSGMAYGFEFGSLTLPTGYIFGKRFPKTAENPILGAGAVVFDVAQYRAGSMMKGGMIGSGTIEVCSLHPNGTTLEAERVAMSDSPDKDL